MKTFRFETKEIVNYFIKEKSKKYPYLIVVFYPNEGMDCDKLVRVVGEMVVSFEDDLLYFISCSDLKESDILTGINSRASRSLAASRCIWFLFHRISLFLS